jgi:hypothetical protein
VRDQAAVPSLCFTGDMSSEDRVEGGQCPGKCEINRETQVPQRRERRFARSPRYQQRQRQKARTTGPGLLLFRPLTSRYALRLGSRAQVAQRLGHHLVPAM